jgi:hypothetical protein
MSDLISTIIDIIKLKYRYSQVSFTQLPMHTTIQNTTTGAEPSRREQSAHLIPVVHDYVVEHGAAHLVGHGRGDAGVPCLVALSAHV